MGNSESATNDISHVFGLTQNVLTHVNDESVDNDCPAINESACYNDDGAFSDDLFQDYDSNQREQPCKDSI